GHLVGRELSRTAKRFGRKPADIAVGFELAPGKSFLGGFVNHHTLALERLGLERCIRGRYAPQRRMRGDEFVQLARHTPSSGDLAFEWLCRKVWTGGRQARIERGHRGSSFALVAIRSPSRSTARAPATVRWITTLRRSASSRRRAIRPSLPIE